MDAFERIIRLEFCDNDVDVFGNTPNNWLKGKNIVDSNNKPPKAAAKKGRKLRRRYFLGAELGQMLTLVRKLQWNPANLLTPQVNPALVHDLVHEYNRWFVDAAGHTWDAAAHWSVLHN